MLSARVKSIVPLLCIIALSLMPMRLHASVADDKTIENHCMQSLISFMRYAESLYCDAGTNACGDSSRQTARLARHTTFSRQSSPTSDSASKQYPEQTITIKTRDTDESILTLTLVCDKENPRIITHTK